MSAAGRPSVVRRFGLPAMKSAKTLIMVILFLLVALLMAGMGVMSSLNLGYSQNAMSELRLRQIEETFHANLDRIDARHKLMEKNTEALARLGELFHRMQQRTGGNRRADLEAALVKKIRDFPEATGGGIWFEPHAWAAGAPLMAAYAAWDGREVGLIPTYASPQYDYPRQPWYKAALPPERDRNGAHEERFHWSPAYYDPVQEDALVTVAGAMRDASGRVVGLATTSWRANEIIRLLSGASVTAGSFSFLIDRNKRTLSSLSRSDDSPATLTLMAGLAMQDLAASNWPTDVFPDGQLRAPMLTRSLSADGRDYALYLSRTRAGMVFGIGVPQDEIDAVLEPMRVTNLRIATATGLVLLILSGGILYFVAGILRLLQTLYTDPLTGLANRARLLRELAAPRDESLVLINIDAFKEINDFYGNRCGDHILRGVAVELQAFIGANAHCRGSVLYKLPGDEFAIHIPACLAPDALAACLRELSAHAHSRVFRWEDQEISVSVTVGATANTSGLPGEGIAGEKLLSSANIALKLARVERHHFGIYEPGSKVREQYEQNLHWAKQLKDALGEDRIVPYFQPINSNSAGRIEKFECLVRLLDRQGVPVGPGQFLGVAKKLRLYREVTRIMVEKSFAAFKDAPYEFSLNLSYEDLADPEITGFIKQRLHESGIGQRVIFEILESEGIQNYQKVRSFIAEVKAFGCRIAIDDFGAGYSNFDHLLRLGADIIKIDGSLIRNLDKDPGAWIVTRGIVQFARELGMRTVAEFVHSAEIQDKVLALGIDYSQGAHFGMPGAEAKAAAERPVPVSVVRQEAVGLLRTPRAGRESVIVNGVRLSLPGLN